MASYPSIDFPNNEIPQTFNKNSFVSKVSQSDNVLTSSLNVLGPSTLNTLNSNTITNTGNLTSNTITSTGLATCNNGLTVTGSILNYGNFASSGLMSLNNGLIVTAGGLTSNTITSSGLLTASNGLTVSSGTVSFPANAIALVSVNGLTSRLTKLDNLTGSTAINSTITSNTLTINYNSNNDQSIFVTPASNFSLVLTNVPTGLVNAMYKLEIYITGKFYCTDITVNGTLLTMTAVGGFANIASQVNASATGLIQTFTIFFTGTTTPTRVNTMLFSTW